MAEATHNGKPPRTLTARQRGMTTRDRIDVISRFGRREHRDTIRIGTSYRLWWEKGLGEWLGQVRNGEGRWTYISDSTGSMHRWLGWKEGRLKAIAEMTKADHTKGAGDWHSSLAWA